MPRNHPPPEVGIIRWGDPRDTVADDFTGALPAWLVGAWQTDGRWLTNVPAESRSQPGDMEEDDETGIGKAVHKGESQSGKQAGNQHGEGEGGGYTGDKPM